MPPYVVGYHPLAAREARSAFGRYARQNPHAAQRFQAALNQVEQRIAAAPDQGAPYRGRFRWMQLRRFPYLLYYEILDPTQVIVYAVAHAHRRPGYWLRRTRP